MIIRWINELNQLLTRAKTWAKSRAMLLSLDLTMSTAVPSAVRSRFVVLPFGDSYFSITVATIQLLLSFSSQGRA
jgi:hypothetical protein